MDTLEFVLKRTLAPTQGCSPDESTVHLWTVGGALSPAYWKPQPVPGAAYLASGGEYHESPTVALRTSDALYVGTKEGVVYKVRSPDAFVEDFQRFQPLTVLSHQDLVWEGHDLHSGARQISALAEHGGIIYDASARGLHVVEAEWCVSPQWAITAQVYGDALATVPSRRRLGMDGSFRCSDAARGAFPSGSLVDVHTGRVLVEQVLLFDGSGTKPGFYSICGEVLAIKHGNSIDEVSTFVLPERKALNSFISPSNVLDFVNHQGRIYARCADWRSRTEGTSSVIDAINQHTVFEAAGPQYVTSIAPGGDAGILLTLYDPAKNMTRITSHQNGAGHLLESEGHLSFLPQRLF